MAIKLLKTTDITPCAKFAIEIMQQSHRYINPEYWASLESILINEYLPNAETWFIDENDEIIACCSILEDKIIALCVNPLYQNLGHGTELIEHIKTQRDELFINVFDENQATISFLENHDFIISSDNIDNYSGAPECTMTWSN